MQRPDYVELTPLPRHLGEAAQAFALAARKNDLIETAERLDAIAADALGLAACFERIARGEAPGSDTPARASDRCVEV